MADQLDQVRAAGFIVAALAPRPAVARVGSGNQSDRVRATMAASDGPAGVALLLGAEGSGLRAATLAAADVAWSIPMADRVDSLNVAAAAAVAFHALSGL